MKDIALYVLGQLVAFEPNILDERIPAADWEELRFKTFKLLEKCFESRKLTQKRKDEILKAHSNMEEIWSAHKPVLDNAPDDRIDSAMGVSIGCTSHELVNYVDKVLRGND